MVEKAKKTQIYTETSKFDPLDLLNSNLRLVSQKLVHKALDLQAKPATNTSKKATLCRFKRRRLFLVCPSFTLRLTPPEILRLETTPNPEN